ncbi:TIGR03086 family metal-binding protein [Micromonospora sp. RHAY321]|uniref:TIGR03086 family metal-binding protein n=1 Tax=Micromonospora sp. RHAY321 TaxID=2944807 RepID=UPI00207D6B48|nr:TIGR03086 family metal-binding protein [Micromonospora sp. RHAY321]MCO1594462.1 TIGR03086 family metal-binding protein [Micromonospora sp. RHAY321]
MRDITRTPDLQPASRALTSLVLGVSDSQLTLPTPCEGWVVGDLLDHLVGLTVAFRLAAEKAPDAAPGGPGNPTVANLDPEWRHRLPAQLDHLVEAWRSPGAWSGDAAAGGVVLPAEVMGLFALDELLVHGWDLARATGQAYDADPETVAWVHGLVSQQESSGGTPGLFGPSIILPAEAALFDRVIGLTGRDPAWVSPAAAAAPGTDRRFAVPEGRQAGG